MNEKLIQVSCRTIQEAFDYSKIMGKDGIITCVGNRNTGKIKLYI
jgi:hypothetical protein